jgi:hypothetical protein
MNGSWLEGLAWGLELAASSLPEATEQQAGFLTGARVLIEELLAELPHQDSILDLLLGDGFPDPPQVEYVVDAGSSEESRAAVLSQRLREHDLLLVERFFQRTSDLPGELRRYHVVFLNDYAHPVGLDDPLTFSEVLAFVSETLEGDGVDVDDLR